MRRGSSLSVFSQQNENSNTLVVNITGFKRLDSGPLVELMLYDSPESFDTDADIYIHRAAYKSAIPQSREVRFEVNDLLPGEYMLMALQDTNDNGELDTGFFGLPNEGYATSQNEWSPEWDKCKFTY